MPALLKKLVLTNLFQVGFKLRFLGCKPAYYQVSQPCLPKPVPRIDNSKQNKDNLIFKSTIVMVKEEKITNNCESEGR